MPRAKKHDHTHLYERVVWGKKGSAIYRCMVEDCSHFIQESLAANRVSQCWGTCGGTVVISKMDVTIGRWHPMCEKCQDERKERHERLRAVGKAEEAVDSWH